MIYFNSCLNVYVIFLLGPRGLLYFIDCAVEQLAVQPAFMVSYFYALRNCIVL